MDQGGSSGRKRGTGHRVKRGTGTMGVECTLAVIGMGGPTPSRPPLDPLSRGIATSAPEGATSARGGAVPLPYQIRNYLFAGIPVCTTSTTQGIFLYPPAAEPIGGWGHLFLLLRLLLYCITKSGSQSVTALARATESMAVDEGPTFCQTGAFIDCHALSGPCQRCHTLAATLTI
eukprot:1191260-Prorocentrum_minimum.AAC.6